MRNQFNHLIGKKTDKSENSHGHCLQPIRMSFNQFVKQFGVIYTFKKCACIKVQLFSSYIYICLINTYTLAPGDRRILISTLFLIATQLGTTQM